MNTYIKNRKLLVKLLGSVSLPPNLTYNQRNLQLRKGVMPKGWNCHHLLPRSCGGGDDIFNLSIIKIKNHERLNKILEGTETVWPISSLNMPELKTIAKRNGAFFIEYK